MREKLALESTLNGYPAVKAVLENCPEYPRFLQAYEIATLPPKLRAIVEYLRTHPEGMTGAMLARAMHYPKEGGGRIMSIQLKNILEKTTCVLRCEKYGERGGLYSFNHIKDNADN